MDGRPNRRPVRIDSNGQRDLKAHLYSQKSILHRHELLVKEKNFSFSSLYLPELEGNHSFMSLSPGCSRTQVMA
ncbi:hypothetical protein Plhal304r1_c002g0007561 [Plasmopara halstedii]